MSKVIKFPVSEAKNTDLHQRMKALGLIENALVESTFKTVKSGGKSGQIGVMIFHPASGLRIRCNRERSRGINRFLARRLLVEQLEKHLVLADSPLVATPKILSTRPPQIIHLPKPPQHWGLANSASSE